MTDKNEHKNDSPHVCPHRFSFILDNWLRKIFQSPKKVAGPFIKPGDTVIDIGSGPGYFTIDMAKMAGRDGKVIAVDLQEHMLDFVKKKAQKHNVADQVILHKCETDSIGLDAQADFILAFYMVHETSDQEAFFKEVKTMLKPGGKILVSEPPFHVKKTDFDNMLVLAENAGLKAISFPKGRKSMSVVLS